MLLLILIVLNEALVELLSKSLLFEGFRLFLLNSKDSILMFFGAAISCPYCCSFWTAMLLILCSGYSFNINFIYFNIVFNYIISILILQRLSNFLHGFTDRYFSTEKDIRYKGN